MQKKSPAEFGGPFFRYAAITAFLGAGLQALFGDFPLRALLWDQNWWNWCAELLGFSWTEWVTSLVVDQVIDGIGKCLGGLLTILGMLLAILTLQKKAGRVVKVVLIIGFYSLLLRSFLIWKEHFWQLGQLIEMFMLLGAPLLYLAYLKRTEDTKNTEESLLDIMSSEPYSVTPPAATTPTFSLEEGPGEREYPLRWLRTLIAFTFIGHGLYAVGFHPVPGHFVFMTQSGLGVGEDAARQLLFGVGVLDFVAAALLFLPWRRAWLAGLVWVVPWAVLTTFARVWSYGGYVELDTLIYQWIPEVVVRLPHILLPLALFFWARTQDAKMVRN
jgi:hypothetical protein